MQHEANDADDGSAVLDCCYGWIVSHLLNGTSRISELETY
jgi:hypothetical protein